jgi:hypothetical protein
MKRSALATYSINWLVFITGMKNVYSAVRTGDLNTAVCPSSVKGQTRRELVVTEALPAVLEVGWGAELSQSYCTVEGSGFDSRNDKKILSVQLQNGLWGPPTIYCPVATVFFSWR